MVSHDLLYQLVGIVNNTYRCDGIGSQMRTNQHRLGIRIADTTNNRCALHFIKNILKLCAEGGILNAVNLTL